MWLGGAEKSLKSSAVFSKIILIKYKIIHYTHSLHGSDVTSFMGCQALIYFEGNFIYY